MKKDILYFLEFPKSEKVFKDMSVHALDVLLNLELLFKNKLNLDKVYHEPDNFIIECNNIIRNIAFVIESGLKLKTKYPWLYEFLNDYRNNNSDQYYILKKIRDNSMHQELFISDGAIDFGLYRVMDQMNYKLKIGMGDLDKIGRMPKYYIYTETELFFQKLLTMHYYLFMDLEHSALWECLGVTRFWKAEVKFKDRNEKNRKEIIDIYVLITSTVSNLINGITEAYCKFRDMEFKKFNISDYSKYNFINTILEIDLYPLWFSRLWGQSIKPLNWKYALEYNLVDKTIHRNDFIIKVYENLPDTRDELLKLLKRYKNIRIENFKDQSDYDKFISFILLPHFYFKNIGIEDILERIDFDEIIKIQKMGEKFVEEINSHFDNIEDKVKNEKLEMIGLEIGKIYNKLKKE